MSQMFHMHPYLVGSSGLQLTGYQTNIAQTFQNLIVGNRFLALVPIRKNGHLQPVFGVARQMPFNSALIFGNIAPNQRNILAFTGFFQKTVWPNGSWQPPFWPPLKGRRYPYRYDAPNLGVLNCCWVNYQNDRPMH